MKPSHKIPIGIAIITTFFILFLAFIQGERADETPPPPETGGNHDPAGSIADTVQGDADHSTAHERPAQGNGSIVLKRTSTPDETELRLSENDHVRTLSATEYSITAAGQVIWTRGEQQIGSVQESPDGTKILFFNYTMAEYELFLVEDRELLKLDVELPHRDQATRVDGWYWLGNNKLIGEHRVPLMPVPRGFGNEGWTKETKLYLYDLETGNHHEVTSPDGPDFEDGPKLTLRDDSDPTYAYELPITRYYSIKGITDDGVIFLVSYDTSQPLGGTPRDEGWFIMENQ